jgi:STE24 endopeptidase
VRVSFGAALALIARIAALLPAFYLFRVERTMNLSVQLTRTWAAFWIGHTVLAMLVAGILAALVLWLVDRTHQWYAYTIVIILGVCIVWSYSSPYFQVPLGRQVEPLTGPLRVQIERALARGSVPEVPIYVEKAQASPISAAVVVGLGRFHRVVLTRTLVVAGTSGEVVYRATYAMGHALHADPLFAALIEGGIIIIFAALAVVLADRIGFRRDDDSLSRFALLGALLALLYLGAVPVRNASLRSYDLDADRYAVSLTGDRASAVRAIVRETDQRMEEVCPRMLTTLFIAEHPSPALRVSALNGIPPNCP